MEEYFVVNSRWKAVLFKTLLNMGWPVRWLPITLEKEKNPEVGYIQSLRELEAENRLLRSAIQDEMEQGGFIGDSIEEVLEDIRAEMSDGF